MEQGYRADQRQVLHVVASHARELVGKRQLIDEWVHHEQRLQQALRVLMPLHDLTPALLLQQAFERLPFALQTVNRLRLLSVFVHREHQAAVQQYRVEGPVITFPTTTAVEVQPNSALRSRTWRERLIGRGTKTRHSD
jgi:hypothetical protein